MYDTESIVKDVEALMKLKLNDEITKINNEKNDDLVLDTINNDKYFFETIDDKLLNYKGFFVLYALIETPTSTPNIENFINGVTVTFQVGTWDKGELQRTGILYKLLRYQRAIYQVLACNSDVFRGYAKPLVKRLKPDSLNYGTKRIILKSGVDITASVTAR